MKMLCRSESEYEIRLINSLLECEDSPLLDVLADRRSLIITTPTVHRYYGSRMRGLLDRHDCDAAYYVLDVDELSKSLASLELICRLSYQVKLDRRGVLVAFGGGVCSDLVGLAASMIRRGVSHLRIPTTLMGQIDAGVGIKSAVNLEGKNYLGSFYPPIGVLIDPSFLATLDTDLVRQGLAEIVKIALVRDRSLFEDLQLYGQRLILSRFQHPADVARQIIEQSIFLMLEQLQCNPYENRSMTRLVDMGHTFSPGLEAASGFSVPHGAAVAIDMALTCLLSAELGKMPVDEAFRVIELISRLGLPVSSPLLTQELCEQAMHETTLHRGGKLNLVLPTEIGRASFLASSSDIGSEMLRRCLDAVTCYQHARASA